MIGLNSVYKGFIYAYVLKKVLRYTTHLFYHAYICAPKMLIKSYVLKLHATSTKLKTKFSRLAKNMKKILGYKMNPLFFRRRPWRLSKNTSNSWAHLTPSIFEILTKTLRCFFLLKAPWGLGLWMQPLIGTLLSKVPFCLSSSYESCPNSVQLSIGLTSYKKLMFLLSLGTLLEWLPKNNWIVVKFFNHSRANDSKYSLLNIKRSLCNTSK
jgi:hypothetical protein